MKSSQGSTATGTLGVRRARLGAAMLVAGALLVVGCSSGSKSAPVSTGGTKATSTGATVTTAPSTTPTTKGSSGGYGY